jgi:hypothetical protein
MKIETWRFLFLGKPFEVPVHFHPSKGEFVATIPEETAAELTGQSYESEQKNPVYGALYKRIKEMIETRELELLEKEVVTKMIAYAVELGGGFEYRVNGRKRSFEGERSQLGISIGWRIVYFSKLGPREQYRDEHGQVTYLEDRRGQEKTMEWTEQRQAFFEGMDARLQGMVLQFDRFFNKASRKNLLSAIDNGGLPALPEPKEKNE